MTTRELLELAAKAAGILVPPMNVDEFGRVLNAPWVQVHDNAIWVAQTCPHFSEPPGKTGKVQAYGDCGWAWPWNPLTDDGDALRLAVKLHIDIHINPWGIRARFGRGNSLDAYLEDYGTIEMAARWAIVRAAAEIGRAM